MINSPVLIAGAGIGGLSVALTLHQIGVPCVVFESVPEIKPLGVGINLQPNAVRELYELGFGPEALDTIGLQTREWVLVGLNGNEVYAEWRGLKAGYKWPQYSMHRGGLQMLLYRAALERLGAAAIRTGVKVTGYRNQPDGKGVTALLKSRNGNCSELEGSLLIAADGLHSAVRAQHIAEFCRKMLALRTSIEGIEDLEIGRDILHDARSWDLILIMRFASVGVLRSYQQHPEHQKVMAFNQPFVADVASVDFE